VRKRDGRLNLGTIYSYYYYYYCQYYYYYYYSSPSSSKGLTRMSIYWFVDLVNNCMFRIEDNVDDAHENISRTKDYLLGVYNSLSSNRPLVIKSALVMIVFILLFVLFVL